MNRLIVVGTMLVVGVTVAEAQQQRKYRPNDQGGSRLQYQIQNANSVQNQSQSAKNNVQNRHSTASSKTFNNNFK